jgi:hypothetical protein
MSQIGDGEFNRSLSEMFTSDEYCDRIICKTLEDALMGKTSIIDQGRAGVQLGSCFIDPYLRVSSTHESNAKSKHL